MKIVIIGLLVTVLIIFLSYFIYGKIFVDNKKIGQQIDTFNGVLVYYNGLVGHVSGRNFTKDGYNLGQKYQCVEFIKRYFYERFNHKMPNSYGHAKDFFNHKIKSGTLNPQRGLIQFSNNSPMKPMPEDLIVFNKSIINPYGHVAIISNVSENSIEIIQQNPGPRGKSRENISLVSENGFYRIDHKRVLGFLRYSQ